MARARQPEGGFTIIELLIVLSVAGLILTIVFMAIPALQRSSRNNERRQDVQAALATISSFELRNSGNFCSSDEANSSLHGCDPNLFDKTKLTYYDPTNISVTPSDLGAASVPTHNPVTDTDLVKIYNHQKCDPTTTGGSTGAAAGYNDIVALYAIESGGSGAQSRCQQL